MNLANKFTMFRVLLVPIFIVFVTIDSFWTNIIALVVFVIAAITDCFDGIIARKYNLVTTFGIFLDPLADKLLVTSAFISFVGKYTLNIPAWMVICIIAREFIITGLRSIAASKNIIITASVYGKIKTTSQMFTIIAILVVLIINAMLAKFYFLTPYELLELSVWQQWLGLFLLYAPYWLMFITTMLTLYSGFTYLLEYKKILLNKIKK